MRLFSKAAFTLNADLLLTSKIPPGIFFSPSGGMLFGRVSWKNMGLEGHSKKPFFAFLIDSSFFKDLKSRI